MKSGFQKVSLHFREDNSKIQKPYNKKVHTVSQNCVGLQTIHATCTKKTFFPRIIFKIMWTYYQKYNYIHFFYNFINSVCISENFSDIAVYKFLKFISCDMCSPFGK